MVPSGARFPARRKALTTAAVVLIGCGGGTEPSARAAATVTIVPAGPISVVAGTSFQLTADVRSADGTLMPDAPVSWSSTDPVNVIIDAQGIVGGTLVATAQVTARSGDAESSPVTVAIVAAAPARLVLTSNRIVLIDSGATVAPTFAAFDAYGNPAATPALAWLAGNEAVSIGDGVITGEHGGSAMVVAQSAANGAVRDSLLVIVAPNDAPLLLTDLARFDLRRDTVFDVIVAVDMSQSGEGLGSANLTVRWPPTLMTFVSDAAAGTTIDPTINRADAGSGVLRIAVADATGWSGRVELRRITFRAAATSQTGALQLQLSELTSAVSFTDFGARTVVPDYPLFTRP